MQTESLKRASFLFSVWALSIFQWLLLIWIVAFNISSVDKLCMITLYSFRKVNIIRHFNFLYFLFGSFQYFNGYPWFGFLRSIFPPPDKLAWSPTNHSTGHQMSRQGLYLPKKAYFGAKMASFWPNIILETTYQETTKPPRSHSFFGQAWHRMDQKGQYLALNDRNAYFWQNLAVVWPKS